MAARTSSRVWLSAQAFFDAAELVWDAGSLARLSGPLLVNYAFSAELSLKAVETKLVQAPTPPSGLIPAASIKSMVGHAHELDTIFQRLHADTQAELASRFEAATGEQLAPLLGKCSNYFAEARYSFERKAPAFDLGGVRTLARGLLESVRDFGLQRGH